MKLHVATGHGAPGLFHNEQALPAAFSEHGIDLVPAHWRDVPADGNPVLIRTAWDYTQHRQAFLTWLEHIGAQAPVVNAPHTIRWNLDKRYLLELAAEGHAIVPTRVVDDRDAAKQSAIDAGWDEAVIKPVVAGGAEGLHTLQDGQLRAWEPAGNAWGQAASEGPFLVQPLLDMAGGEWSLFYFGGSHSHAVLKRPAHSDIRVQEEHGGTTEAATPPPHVRAACDALAAATDAVQVRVDGVDVDGRFLLMELELIEPELYFRYATGAEARFAAAVAATLY